MTSKLFEIFLTPTPRETWHEFTSIARRAVPSLCGSWTSRINCLVESPGLPKVTCSHIHCKVVMSRKRCKTEIIISVLHRLPLYMLLQTTKSPTRSDIWPIEYRRPWVTFKFIYLLQKGNPPKAFRIRCFVVVQQLTWFQLYGIGVVGSLCDRLAACMYSRWPFLALLLFIFMWRCFRFSVMFENNCPLLRTHINKLWM